MCDLEHPEKQLPRRRPPPLVRASSLAGKGSKIHRLNATQNHLRALPFRMGSMSARPSGIPVLFNRAIPQSAPWGRRFGRRGRRQISPRVRATFTSASAGADSREASVPELLRAQSRASAGRLRIYGGGAGCSDQSPGSPPTNGGSGLLQRPGVPN